MSLLTEASLVILPNAVKEGELFSIIPADGSGDMTAVRATTATLVNSERLIEDCPYNLLQRSEEFENAYWVKTNSTSISNQIISPNGTLTADKLNETSTSGYHFFASGNVASGTYTSSVFVKKGERNFVLLWNNGSNSGRFFNIENGTLGGTLGAVPLNSNIEDYGNGWFRCSIVNNNVTNFGIYIAISSTMASYLGEVGKGIYIWGAQLVTGTEPKEYFPTTDRLNVPRLDYTNGSCPSILVEPQRTNLVFPSATATTQLRTVTAVAHTLSFYGTGSVTLSGVATGTLVGTGISNRVTLTFTPTAGSLILTVTGSITNWQLEAGSNATSYIPTVASAVTRNADVISKTGISDLIGQSEGTIFVDFNKAEIANSSGILELGELNNEIVIWQNAATQLRFFVRVSGSVFGSRTYNISDERLKIALTYQSNSYSVFLNGIKILDNIPITSLSTSYSGIILGNRFTNPSLSALNSSINSVVLWKTKLTDEQCISLTTI